MAIPSTERGTELSIRPARPSADGTDRQSIPPLRGRAARPLTEQRDDVLSFTSLPVDHELVISGWPSLKLFASSDCNDIDWHVKVTDVDVDGRLLRLTQGCLRAAYRNSLANLEPLNPDVTYQFLIEFWPTHHVLKPGHSIRLTVTSSDFPWFARSLNQFGPVHLQNKPKVAINTVRFGGGFPSRLVLPIEG